MEGKPVPKIRKLKPVPKKKVSKISTRRSGKQSPSIHSLAAPFSPAADHIASDSEDELGDEHERRESVDSTST